MTPRQRVLKTTLWAIVGVLLVVTFARFSTGLGATTGLSDAAPWGFWIAFDVMAGVALAAGGFVLAATVYIFGLERYRPFVRPAILTAFLGYIAVAVGLTYDLGLPWHIWHPAIYPQPHSVLFEVAMCVMLYLTVLLLEFAPVILEHRAFNRPVFNALHRGLKRGAIVFVIAGIVLSSLHQSSLGSLYLIAPFRLHPLWYSPIIWVLFLVSAIGLGLMTVTLESYFSAWYFGHPLRMGLLPGLGRAASVVLLLYAALRLGDLGARGVLEQAFDGSFLANLFLFELGLSAVVPGVLLLVPAVRRSPRGLGIAALMTVFGMVGYRFDVCVVAFDRPAGTSYFPTWPEVAVSVGIVAVALLVFIFFVEKLKVYPEADEVEAERSRAEQARKRFDPGSLLPMTPDSIGAPRRHSLALVFGLAFAVALLPSDALFGAQPAATPVEGPRTVDGYAVARDSGQGTEFILAGAGQDIPKDAAPVELRLIDGNRDGRLVPFPHDAHVERMSGAESCAQCHHQNLPLQKNSSCASCHRDMYSVSDTFDHQEHIDALDGNQSCQRCHRDPHQPKTRATATPCADCHRDMVVEGSRVQPPKEGLKGFAPGYMDAMHELCVTCHQEQAKAEPEKLGETFGECTTCHRELDGSVLRRLAPYQPRTGGGQQTD